MGFKASIWLQIKKIKNEMDNKITCPLLCQTSEAKRVLGVSDAKMSWSSLGVGVKDSSSNGMKVRPTLVCSNGSLLPGLTCSPGFHSIWGTKRM